MAGVFLLLKINSVAFFLWLVLTGYKKLSKIMRLDTLKCSNDGDR